MIEYLHIEGIKKAESSLITDEFAKFFSGIGKEYSNKIKKPINSAEHYLNKIQGSNKTLFLHPATHVEIDSIIKNIAPKKSSGHDGISNKLLKDIGPALCYPLQIVFNKSLELGKFPDIIKLADVVPLHKNKGIDSCTNYRSISLLLTISKILEKIVYKCAYGFLDSTKQLYESQYGFRSHHSCKNAITELTGSILKGAENKKLTLSVFLDLSKAFDTKTTKKAR